jgi:hypothetical protein
MAVISVPWCAPRDHEDLINGDMLPWSPSLTIHGSQCHHPGPCWCAQPLVGHAAVRQTRRLHSRCSERLARTPSGTLGPLAVSVPARVYFGRSVPRVSTGLSFRYLADCSNYGSEREVVWKLLWQNTFEYFDHTGLESCYAKAATSRSTPVRNVAGDAAKQRRKKPSPPVPNALPGARPTCASSPSRLARARLSRSPSTWKNR